MSKCNHATSIELFRVDNVTVSRCEWECKEVLVSVKCDDVMTVTFTESQLRARFVRAAEADALRADNEILKREMNKTINELIEARDTVAAQAQKIEHLLDVIFQREASIRALLFVQRMPENEKDAMISEQAQTIETARERIADLESAIIESCGDHPENSCESWCDQCKRGADALRKAFAANAPTPTQGETLCDVCNERPATVERDGRKFCGYCYGSYAALTHGEEFATMPKGDTESEA